MFVKNKLKKTNLASCAPIQRVFPEVLGTHAQHRTWLPPNFRLWITWGVGSVRRNTATWGNGLGLEI